MSQNAELKCASSKTLLSFNMREIDDLFPGFVPGDFAVLEGHHSISLSLLLAVRAQLPYQLGGLESSVIFIDGGNTFRLYKVSKIAQKHSLRPRDVLGQIFISRAFTAHQMTSIILDKLEETTRKYGSKLVIVSDFLGLYLDKDIQLEESKEVFMQVAAWLSNFTRENSVIVLTTCPPHYYSRRNAFFQAVARGRSNVAISITKKPIYPFDKQFTLEKHPVFKLGSANFPSENMTLNDFVGGI